MLDTSSCHSDDSVVFVSELTLDQARAVAQMDEVVFVAVRGEIVFDMNIARSISGADHLETVEGFTGQGVRGEVMDSGVFVGHNALNPLIHGGNDPNTHHGTQVYGVVFGDGTSSPILGAKGVLPDATGYFSSVFYDENLLWNPDCDPGGGVIEERPFTRKEHIGELVDPNLPYKCVFQTNSWSLPPRTTTYEPVSAELDDAVFEHDIVVCQSQGNEGSNVSGRQAWAKNVVSVGGIHHFDVECRDDDRWCDGCDPPVSGCAACAAETPGCTCQPGSQDCTNVCINLCPSTGPAWDGRVKPDLVHYFDNILTTCDGDAACYSDNEFPHPVPFGGTSAATPITCGHIGLIFQMWHEGVFRGFGGGATVFDSRPHSSTARALAINTAYQYPIGTQQQTDMTRDNQGWGMIDVENLYDRRDNLLIVNESDLLQEMQTVDYTICVPASEPALRATLVFTDPMGNCAATLAKINDLSLKVTSPSADVYWGNNGLLTGNWSVADADPLKTDAINTVENVFVQNPEAGQWTITVSADEIVVDGHVETPSTVDADFALVVSGLRNKSACCTQPFGICKMLTQDKCDSTGGVFHFCEACPIVCEGTQGPQQGP